MPRYGGKMRYYKDCPVLNMGCSDIAALVLVGFIHSSGRYSDSGTLQKIETFNKWLKVYDDE